MSTSCDRENALTYNVVFKSTMGPKFTRVSPKKAFGIVFRIIELQPFKKITYKLSEE
jgi:hypothetical protein